MDANNRRKSILSELKKASSPLSATVLASKFNVSRQIVVGDIALLRASGESITATPRGYIVTSASNSYKGTVACVHNNDQITDELNIMVDNGCTVVNVIVEHAVYGQITGELDISSRYDVKHFVDTLNAESSMPLLSLTGGVHLHVLSCADKETFDRTCNDLSEAGFLYEE